MIERMIKRRNAKNAVYKSFIFGFTGTSHKRFIVYLQAKLASKQERNGG
jgi:hypothetical protein